MTSSGGGSSAAACSGVGLCHCPASSTIQYCGMRVDGTRYQPVSPNFVPCGDIQDAHRGRGDTQVLGFVLEAQVLQVGERERALAPRLRLFRLRRHCCWDLLARKNESRRRLRRGGGQGRERVSRRAVVGRRRGAGGPSLWAACAGLRATRRRWGGDERENTRCGEDGSPAATAGPVRGQRRAGEVEGGEAGVSSAVNRSNGVGVVVARGCRRTAAARRPPWSRIPAQSEDTGAGGGGAGRAGDAKKRRRKRDGSKMERDRDRVTPHNHNRTKTKAVELSLAGGALCGGIRAAAVVNERQQTVNRTQHITEPPPSPIPIPIPTDQTWWVLEKRARSWQTLLAQSTTHTPPPLPPTTTPRHERFGLGDGAGAGSGGGGRTHLQSEYTGQRRGAW